MSANVAGQNFVTGSQLLKAARERRRVEEVYLPALDVTVRVAAMTLEEKDDFEVSLLEDAPDGSRRTNLKGFTAKLLAATLVDAEGNRLLTEAQATEIGRGDSDALRPAVDVARRLNGMDTKTAAATRGN